MLFLGKFRGGRGRFGVLAPEPGQGHFEAVELQARGGTVNGIGAEEGHSVQAKILFLISLPFLRQIRIHGIVFQESLEN